MTDLADLHALARRIPAAYRNLDKSLPGYGTGGSDGPSSGTSNRTMMLALKRTMETDDAVRDRARLRAIEATIKALVLAGAPFGREMGELKRLLDYWAPTARMTEGIRATGDDSGAGWCQSHWRAGSHCPPKNVGGKLCRWCQDWVRALNDPAGEWAMSVEMPPLQMVEAHSQGRRIDGLLPPRRRI